MAAPTKPTGRTLAFSWGPSGGFYFNRGYTTRLCLGRLAVTLIPQDLDEVLTDAAALHRAVTAYRAEADDPQYDPVVDEWVDHLGWRYQVQELREPWASEAGGFVFEWTALRDGHAEHCPTSFPTPEAAEADARRAIEAFVAADG